MPFVRAPHDSGHPYTKVDNGYLSDSRLKLSDKGLLTVILSLPDDWQFSERGIADHLGLRSRNGLRASLDRLEQFGYLKRESKARNMKGVFVPGDWAIIERPESIQVSKKHQDTEETPDENQAPKTHQVKPQVGTWYDLPPTEKRTEQITKQQRSGFEGEGSYPAETASRSANVPQVDIQPAKSSIADTEKRTASSWTRSFEICPYCAQPVITNGEVYKCVPCSTAWRSLDELLDTRY